MSNLKYVFVHGLSGWGSYDKKYQKKPYWGMKGGDLLTFLREKGFDCYAASVAPHGSAWDRACELYAQLSGTRVDYGKRHSLQYRHERFGRDFSECPLIDQWNEDTRLVLIGHSFGGATVRLFSEILIHGAKEEIESTEADDLSPFFLGGAKTGIHSIVTLAAPLNGTTAYNMLEDENFDPEGVKVPWWSTILAKILSRSVVPVRDGRDPRDYADYDMHVDAAAEMNRHLTTFANIYYFSIPCSSTEETRDGIHCPIRKITDPFFVKRSCQIGCYSGTTKGGTVIDSTWHENDGLVNTISARAPFGQPQQKLNRKNIQPGVWNIFPVFKGDHMMIHGGLTKKRDVKTLYVKLLSMIDAL
ncbi:MAG: hypothetical protein Q4D81_03130 [Eubacteriales bacterium]|nr:hypothetical protein [Eubacteriales bacterium]